MTKSNGGCGSDLSNSGEIVAVTQRGRRFRPIDSIDTRHYTTRGNRLRELDRGDRFAGKARGGRILKYATDEQRSQRAERPVQNRKM